MPNIESFSWVQVGAVLAFVGGLFVLYRLLVEQKDATIQSQKENIAFLKDQLAEAKDQAPDVLAQNLARRVGLLEDELKRLESDKTSTQAQILAKESELNEARQQAESLGKKVLHARELLKDFLCPYCGAPLVERAHQSESVEYRGRELDIEHEHTAFECGFELVDGQVRGQCRTFNTSPVA